MNNLRRTLSLLLALVMLVALGTVAMAENNAEAEENVVTLTEEDVASLAYLNGQLRVGMECAYAPNNWQESEASETNVPIENVPGAYAEGYDVQIARIIADQLGLELVVVKMDWDGLIEALNQGQIDAIIAGMADTESRKEAINFTSPYHETVYALMVNAGTQYENATSLADFNGASVLGQKDTALDWTIDQIEGVNHLTAVASVPDMIARLQQGTCDAIVINLENAPGYLAMPPVTSLPTRTLSSSASPKVRDWIPASRAPASVCARATMLFWVSRTRFWPPSTRSSATSSGIPR